MHALKDLVTTDVSLMSVAGFAFMRYFLRHMQEDSDKAATQLRHQ